MKKQPLLPWILLWVAWATQAQQLDRLQTQPARPQPGDSVKVIYHALEGPLKTARQIFATAYAVKPDASAERTDIPMSEKEKGVWEGKFKAHDAAVSVFFDIRDGKTADNNGSKGYYLLLTDAQGKPLPHASGAMAVFYETLGMRLIGQRNDETLIGLLTDELQRFPQHKQPYLFHLLGNLLFINRKEEAQAYASDFETLSQKSDLSEKELGMAAQIYRMLGRQQDAERLADEELRRFPTGKTARMTLFNEFSRADEPPKKRALFDAYREKMGIDATLINMATALAQEYFNRLQWNEGIALTRSLPLDEQTASLYISVAGMLAEAKRYDEALPIARETTDMLGQQWEEAIKKGTPNSNAGNILFLLAQARGKTGAILVKQDKAAEALPLLEQAAEFEELLGEDFRASHALALAQAGEPDKALEIISRYVRENKANSAVKEALQMAYVRAKGSPTGWEEYLEDLEKRAFQALSARIASEMIDEPAPAFTLTNLAGQTVSTESLRGKVVVLDFWATWCGPCIASFPAMKKVIEHYQERDDVLFLFINSWERVEDKRKHVGEFLAKKDYNFNVLMDEDNSVINAYKVGGIPTKFVIDKHGRIRFKSVGFNGSLEQTVKKMQIMIDTLAEM